MFDITFGALTPSLHEQLQSVLDVITAKIEDNSIEVRKLPRNFPWLR